MFCFEHSGILWRVLSRGVAFSDLAFLGSLQQLRGLEGGVGDGKQGAQQAAFGIIQARGDSAQVPIS